MNSDQFQTEFPWVAVMLAVGVTTTVEYKGRVYSFKKLGPGEFTRVF